MNKLQSIGRTIRSTEAFEDFIKRLQTRLMEFRDNHFKGCVFMSHTHSKISDKDLQRLLLEIESRKLVIVPYCCGGFAPAYEIVEMSGNPLFEYDKIVLLDIHERQLPDNFKHTDMKKFFKLKENIERASLLNETINLNDSSYYY